MSEPAKPLRQDDVDRRVAKLVSSALASESSAGTANEEEARFQRLATALPAEQQALLSDSWKAARAYRHAFKRKPSDEYRQILEGLVRGGYRETSAVMFVRLYPSLKESSRDEFLAVLGTVKAVDQWLKLSGAAKADLAREVVAEPRRFYQTIGFDWAIERVPVGRLIPLLETAVTGGQRPLWLCPADGLVRNAIRRDRSASLSKGIGKLCSTDATVAKRIVDAVIDVQASNLGWASRIALELLGEDREQLRIGAAGVFEERLLSSDAQVAGEAALFASGVAGALEMAHARLRGPKKDLSRALIATLSDLTLRGSRRSGKDAIWLFGPSTRIRSALCDQGELVSDEAGFRIALGLRAVEQQMDPAEALEAVSRNLGLEPIGSVGEVAVFDSKIHEDRKGGLVGGERVRIAARGWRRGTGILLRAEVEGELGGS